MKKSIPRVLIVFTERRSDTSTWFGGFVKRLQKRPGLDGINIDYVALEDLIFEIKDDYATVYDVRTNGYIEDYTWVYFKRWMSMPDEAAALAIFLRAKGIPFADESVINKNDGSKLVSQFRFWANGVPVADTIHVSPAYTKEALLMTNISYPLVIKDANGQKGNLNFIANNLEESIDIINKYPRTKFLIQNYIDNNFDYRIQVYGGKAVVGVRRVGKKGSHLNNESAGGESSFIPYDEIPKVVLELAEAAAAAVGLQVSGVDVLPNIDETKHVILEANQGSQIVTGDTSGGQVAIIDEFNSYIAKMSKTKIKRTVRSENNRKTIVGIHEIVDLPELGLNGAHAKIDTGAYRCSIHAENISIVKRAGKEYLQFSVPAVALKRSMSGYIVNEVENFKVVPIRKSTNLTEHRYIIETKLFIGGRTMTTTFSLTNRGSMRYPILIGRKVLSGRFLVNSSFSVKD